MCSEWFPTTEEKQTNRMNLLNIYINDNSTVNNNLFLKALQIWRP